MCLPPDVSTPALPPIGRRRDVNPSAWSTDPRAQTNWGAPPPQAAGAGWPSWVEFFNLPQSGFSPKDDAGASIVIEAAPLGSLLASALSQEEVPKTCQPQPNWAAPLTSPFYCSPQPSSYGGGMDAGAALMHSAQGSPTNVAVSASAKSMMTSLPLGVESLERPKEEDKSQADSLFDELYQEGRSEQETAAKKLCITEAKIAKPACHKTKQAARPGVKKETTVPKDVCMGESDMEASEDEGEGAPVISEKRRKRMLSNRASAQRSRQRRQERLDTLEVLVAQLRVENAALKTKASTSAATVKKLEDENRILRERLDAKEQNQDCQVSAGKNGADNDSQSLKTTGGNSSMCDAGNSRGDFAMTGKMRTGDTDSSSENSDPNKRVEELSAGNMSNNVNTANNSCRVVNQVTKGKRSRDEAVEKDWSFNSNLSAVFNIENIESVGNSTSNMTKHKSTPRVGMGADYAQEYESVKSLASLPQFPAFTQEFNAFDMDLEHSPDIDKKILDSVEEIWLDGFSDVCFK